MSNKNKEKKKMNKPTIFFTFLFMGFAAGTILGIGLKQIKIEEVIVQSFEEKINE
ncbi:MAG: hypothetical protein ACRC63_01180 [Metamycoplasmataceae bacterium]